MIAEAEVWRAAVALVRRHGTDASFAVAAYADQLVEDGNMAAAAECERVLNAIERLQAPAPTEGEKVH
jgi:xanthine dehydrogenase molybdopterin-binding subunit B